MFDSMPIVIIEKKIARQNIFLFFSNNEPSRLTVITVTFKQFQHPQVSLIFLLYPQTPSSMKIECPSWREKCHNLKLDRYV